MDGRTKNMYIYGWMQLKQREIKANKRTRNNSDRFKSSEHAERPKRRYVAEVNKLGDVPKKQILLNTKLQTLVKDLSNPLENRGCGCGVGLELLQPTATEI